MILEAAARCFRANGFRGASISDICRESGVGVGNLYHYFDGKEAMVEAIAAQDGAVTARILDELDRADDIVERIRQLASAAEMDEGYVVDDALAVEIIAEAARNPRVAAIRRETDLAVRKRLAEVLAGAQRRGTVDPTLNPDATAWLVVSLFEGLSLRRITDTPEEYHRGLLRVRDHIVELLNLKESGGP
ncbi:TetR/AcrR family transcriptional regulator [Belnapia sp. T18]|uniref:TetR/AcrR family transcriptional regulator n=1 Tax=Belnapia arida TaxID=2804533 RepID=A0ABS1UC97_9PROT|nr:TetR/AcrR family transcriptional regulator [Belnapia arida]MBL6082306.1 TetR/AcrR family transcriptional regulator [Belnapia arida]